VRVLQPGDGLDLAKEALGTERGDQFRPEDLEGDGAVKAEVLGEVRRSPGLTRVELAKRLGKAEGEIRRMLDPYHATKLPALEEAMKALGKRYIVLVEEMA